jgi:hypothetical protein
MPTRDWSNDEVHLPDMVTVTKRLKRSRRLSRLHEKEKIATTDTDEAAAQVPGAAALAERGIQPGCSAFAVSGIMRRTETLPARDLALPAET